MIDEEELQQRLHRAEDEIVQLREQQQQQLRMIQNVEGFLTRLNRERQISRASE